MSELKYTAFISYRHGGKDEFAAQNLHRALESYHIPATVAKETGKKNIGRIFRDVDELPTSDSLYNNIEEALEQSEYLIVICTPRLKESQWCMREIELFVRLRGVEHVLAVLAEGEPKESFPDMLTHRVINGQEVEVEPLAADVRGDTERKVKKQIKNERLRLLASMLNCEFDQLRQRARQRQRLQRGIIGGIAAAVVIGFLSMMTIENLRLQSQVSRTQKAQSYLLSQYSKECYQADDPMTAALLALEGLPEQLGSSRPFVGDSMSALTTSLLTYNYQKGYVPDRSINTETMDSVFLSTDGKYLVYVDLNKNQVYHAHFYDTAKNEVIAEFEMNGDYCSSTCSDDKVVFFNDHYCALAGAEGVQVIDTDTMEEIWSGEATSSVEVSKDGKILSAYNYLDSTVSFYNVDGTFLSSQTFDCEESLSMGLNADGSSYAVTLRQEEKNQLLIIDTATGEVKKEVTKDLTDAEQTTVDVCSSASSWSENILAFVVGNDDGDGYLFVSYDADADKLYRTQKVISGMTIRLDSSANIATSFTDTKMEEFDMFTGEITSEYTAGGAIADASYCGNERYEIICSDGALEYVDFSDTPYCISKNAGNGLDISRMSVGGEYMAAAMINTYHVLLYRLNDKATELTGNLPRRGTESNALYVRNDNLICLNTTDNTYTVNADTLDVVTYKSPISFMQLGNNQTVLLDDYQGTYTTFDADTGEELASISTDATILNDAAYLLDVDAHVLNAYDYKTGEILAEYPVGEKYTDALVLDDHLVCIFENVENPKENVIDVYDMDGKLLKTFPYTNLFINEDLMIYQEQDSTDFVIMDPYTLQERMKYSFGNVDWCSPGENAKYMFVSTTDNGGYITNNETGEIILTLPDVSTVYNMTCYVDSAYFSLLYIEEGGTTRLDIYEKENPESPIARIPGGLGISRDDKVLVYDGASTIYAADIQSKESIYQQGLDYVGEVHLTERQKEEYHCQ